MASSTWIRTPPAVTWLFRRFPLVCHPSQLVETGSAPSKPTLWILGRSNATANDEPSFDVRSLRRQAELRFRGVDCDVRTWETEDGGVEGRLPALHLPDGSLLADHAIDAWLDKHHPLAQPTEDSVSQEAAAWYALVETKLFPALTAHLFVDPLFDGYTMPRYHPRSRSPGSPFLARLIHDIVGSSHRATALANVRAIVGGTSTIDLEDLETEASDALDAFAERLASSAGWFLETGSPLPLDAALFAHLHAILALPSLKTESPSTTNRLRAAVERHDGLVQWTRRLERKYFDI